jgi:LacI family transcriptional regulator
MLEVAREAGVSTTTVSHVLNGTRPVKKETVERVRAAVERTGYRPNTAARALAGARTQTIGLAISGISNPYFMGVIAAIEAEAAKRGHTLLLADTHDESKKELQVVQDLLFRQVDGLLLAPSAGAETKALHYLSKQSVPVVLLDRFLPVDMDQVGTENEKATTQLVEHLLGLGHRRVGFVAGLDGLSTTRERVSGYRTALLGSGIPVDEELVAYGASQRDPARNEVHRLLDLKNAPTALVVANNFMTIGALRALRDRGVSVPGDIALVAFDDFEWSDLFRPRLTVIAQPTIEIGTRAVHLLLSRLEDPNGPPRLVRLQPTFIHRESCGCESDMDGH